jgi:uncharacterized protein involved in propanediol utilization
MHKKLQSKSNGLRVVAAHGAREQGSNSPKGQAQVCTHCGELFQGKFTMPWGPARGLVTLSCPVFQSAAEVELTVSGEIRTEPAGLEKAAAGVRQVLDYFGVDCGAIVRISSNIPPGIGAGSSTGDVVAAILATARALRRRLSDREVGILAVETETACDPTMFDPSIVRLWGQRFGITLEVFERGLPPLEALSICDGDPVSTLDLSPARYSTRMICEFDFLRDAFRKALIRGDAAMVGAIATRSAEINQGYLAKKRFADWVRLLHRYGAVGLAVSHSGSAVTFLFDGMDDDRGSRIEELICALKFLDVMPRLRFELGLRPVEVR